MTRTVLLSKLAKRLGDYRSFPKDVSVEDHIDKWVSQFDAAVQVPILEELRHVFRRTYFNANNMRHFLETVAQAPNLVGTDPKKFWAQTGVLNIQQRGDSQRDMIAIFDDVLTELHGTPSTAAGNAQAEYVFLDDACYTGMTLINDIGRWIDNSAPTACRLNIVVIGLHSNGKDFANRKLTERSRSAKKAIDIKWWCSVELEDRQNYTDVSDVLRPHALPSTPEVTAYVSAMTYKPRLRVGSAVGGKGVFSGDAGRKLLEQQFLDKGAWIRTVCKNLNQYQRPLGNSVLETLGFGSTIATFRNCPNNAPLVFWVGDPWYPLFPRTTNSATEFKRTIDALFKEVRK